MRMLVFNFLPFLTKYAPKFYIALVILLRNDVCPQGHAKRKDGTMKKLIALLLTLVLGLSMVAGVGAEGPKAAKYVFFFIGDGMGGPQVTATQYYLGVKNNPEAKFPTPENLSFTTFKTGLITTYDATSFNPDSASTASSMAAGEKTLSGVINYDVNKERPFKLVTEYAKEAGMKIGVMSTVSVDHATPAAFYAKVPSRNSYYDIAVQGMTGTTLDLLGGGGFKRPTGDKKDQKDIFEIAKENNFTLVNTLEGIRGLKPEDGERILMTVPDTVGGDAMQYEIDRRRLVSEGTDSASIAELTKSAINYLKNDNGFFLMVEGGKIDWCGHANDAMTSIYDTIALADAVQVALDFAQEYPEETLIVVTGDHETGGLALGFATTAYDTHYYYLDNQKQSYEDFDKIVAKMREEKTSFEDALKQVEACYGLTTEGDTGLKMTEQELASLKAAYEKSMLGKEAVMGSEEALLYGGYEPLTVTCSHILNNKAGLAYTSYAHTGLQIPVYSYGQNSDLFVGSYDNTDIFTKFMAAMNLTPDAK